MEDRRRVRAAGDSPRSGAGPPALLHRTL